MNFPILKKKYTINIYPDVIHKETAKYNVYVIKYELREFIKPYVGKIILQGKKDRHFEWKVTFICPIQHVVKRVQNYYTTLDAILDRIDAIMSDFRSFIDLNN